MFSAAVRVLARAAAIQLEEAAAAHPRPPRTLLKGKERAIPIRRDIRAEPVAINSDLGLKAGVEGIGAKQENVTDTTSRGYPNGGGLEEQLGSITDELPVRVDQNSAGPSRPLRHTLITKSNSKPVAIESTKKPSTTYEQERHEVRFEINDNVTPANEAKATARPVEATPAVTKPSMDTPVASEPIVEEPVTAASPPIANETIPSLQHDVEASIPSINEPPIPLAEEAEDVSRIILTSLSKTDWPDAGCDASIQSPVIKNWSLVSLRM
jgi:hypothetical protein